MSGAGPDPDARLSGSIAGALALLERVSAGEILFDEEQRRWALTEGVELSGWTLTEVQLADGGDALLAQRVLDFARTSEASGRRRLVPMAAAAPKHPVRKSQDPPVDAVDGLLLRHVVAGRVTLSPRQREQLVVDLMIASAGELATDLLLGLGDAALAGHAIRLQMLDNGAAAASPAIAA